MNLTIVPADGAVYVDGESFAGLQFAHPPEIHALQWKGTKGWLEFVDRDDGTKPQNEPITELPVWALEATAKWGAAKETAARLAAEAAAQPVTIGAQTL